MKRFQKLLVGFFAVFATCFLVNTLVVQAYTEAKKVENGVYVDARLNKQGNWVNLTKKKISTFTQSEFDVKFGEKAERVTDSVFLGL